VTAPPVRGPWDLPELRNHLVDLWRGPAGRGIERVMNARSIYNGGRPTTYGQFEVSCLQGATLWWVSAEMVDVLTAAAPSMPDDVTWNDLPKPSPWGLVVFEKPLQGIDADRDDATVQVDAIVWGGANLPPLPEWGRPTPTQCLTVSSYRRLDFGEGLSANELELATATGLVTRARSQVVGTTTQDQVDQAVTHDEQFGVSVLPADGMEITTLDGQRAKVSHGTFTTPDPGTRRKLPAGAAVMSLTGEEWAPLGRSDWPVSEPLATAPFPGMSERQLASYVEDRRLIAGLWALLNQRVMTRTTLEEPARPVRRRAQRAGITDPDLSRVRVVTLRRPDRPEGEAPPEVEGSGRTYTHRWIVNPFWRNQPCGPGGKDRRLTLVSGHVKGPADAPLVDKQEVRAWVR
jgi:hypothetical protein